VVRDHRRPAAERGVLELSETFDLGPTRLQVVAATAEATVLAGELQPGGGSAWHVHTLEDETLIVTSGTLAVDDGERRELSAGDAPARLRRPPPSGPA
jgi:quercetin dioxygenase-like cupin family protein